MKQLILPVIVMLTGTGAATASKISADADSKLVNRQGYIFNTSTVRCDKVQMCRTENGPICTVDNQEDGQQVFGTSGSDVDHPLTCSVTLYKIP